jgi:drug/metabolite transporter (DMT)-like permease
MSCRPFFAILASAALFGVSTPLAKLLLGGFHPLALAGLLYAGAFAGLAAARLVWRGADRDQRLEWRDAPWLAGAILAGGILAPILLMLGLSRVSGFAGSLLLNFETVATALIAVALFREQAGRPVWAALLFMTSGGVLLAWNPAGGRLDLAGPLLVLAAMAGWGLDNNLTRQIADKDPIDIALIKGLVSGTVSLSLAFATGHGFVLGPEAAAGLAVGAIGYGLSLVLFIRGLRGLGAFRAGALFGLAPFVGALASVVILGDRIRPAMAAAGLLMAAAAVFILRERHVHAHHHDPVVHTHAHAHTDGHHLHEHAGQIPGRHVHEHAHSAMDHTHGHWPDSGHRHGH